MAAAGGADLAAVAPLAVTGVLFADRLATVVMVGFAFVLFLPMVAAR